MLNAATSKIIKGDWTACYILYTSCFGKFIVSQVVALLIMLCIRCLTFLVAGSMIMAMTVDQQQRLWNQDTKFSQVMCYLILGLNCLK